MEGPADVVVGEVVKAVVPSCKADLADDKS